MADDTESHDSYSGLSLLVTALAVLVPVFYWSSRPHVSELDRVTVGSACVATGLCYLAALAIWRWMPASGPLAVGLVTPAAAVFAFGASLWALFQRGWGNRGGQPFEAVFVITVIACVIVAAGGLILGRTRAKAFVVGSLMSVAIMGVGGTLASTVLGAELKSLQQSRTDVRIREIRAANLVYELTACALKQRYREPVATFPRSLDSIPTGPRCDGSPPTPASLEGYTLAYLPRRAPDGSTIADFQIVATPANPSDYYASVVADGRGLIVIVHEPPPSTGRSDTGAFIVRRASGLSFIQGHRRIITEFIERQTPPAAPRTLDAVVTSDPTRYEAGYIRRTQRDSIYRVEYVPPSATSSREFGLLATCLKYGADCLRSYYLGPDGTIHATGEPRAAALSDPPIVDGEDSDGPLRGAIGWRGR